MVQKRRPLEFSDPYDESVPGGSGGNRWMSGNKPLPDKKHKRTRDDDLKEIDRLMLDMVRCPGCGSISADYVAVGMCPECGHQE
jgi:hypothetical protein